ncbi:hypothetical protein [Pseudomonas sp. RT6P73]
MNNKHRLGHVPEKATLEFLTHYDAHRLDDVHSASFLHSPFEQDCWTLKFGHSNAFELDFRIVLSDTLTLGQCDHGELVKLFKMWICSAEQGSASKGIFASSVSIRARVNITVKLIDYFLLNWQALGIAQNGLRLFTANDMKTLLVQLASCARSTTSIYEWPRRLNAFLQTLVESTQETSIAQTLAQFPFLAESPVRLDGLEGGSLIDQQLVALGGLTPDKIIRLRAVLWQQGLYKRNGATDFQWGLNTDKIIKALYANRTLGRIKCPSPQILSLLPMERWCREHPPAPTRHQHRAPNIARMGEFIHVLQGLNSVSAYSCSCPLSPFPEVNRTYLVDQFNITRSGRYISAPVSAVLIGIRHAIEFYLVYGQAILSSYLDLARAAHQAGAKPSGRLRQNTPLPASSARYCRICMFSSGA